jgi:hypothetical protein
MMSQVSIFVTVSFHTVLRGTVVARKVCFYVVVFKGRSPISKFRETWEQLTSCESVLNSCTLSGTKVTR